MNNLWALFDKYEPKPFNSRTDPLDRLVVIYYESGDLAKCIVRGKWNNNLLDYRGEVKLAIGDIITQLRLISEIEHIDFQTTYTICGGKDGSIGRLGVFEVLTDYFRRLGILTSDITLKCSLNSSMGLINCSMKDICLFYDLEFIDCLKLGEEHLEERLKGAREYYDKTGEWK